MSRYDDDYDRYDDYYDRDRYDRDRYYDRRDDEEGPFEWLLEFFLVKGLIVLIAAGAILAGAYYGAGWIDTTFGLHLQDWLDGVLPWHP